MVTVFPNITTMTPTYREVETILNAQKTDPKNVLIIRNDPNYNDRKKELGVICFGGKFSKRSNKALLEASGLMILDFDKVDMDQMRGKLMHDEYIYSFWISPSGKGYKALVKIPVVENDDEYKGHYLAFSKRYPELDESGKDISRACFYSYDPDLVVKESKLFTETEKPNTLGSKVVVDYTKNDYSIASRVLNIIRAAQAGERNIKIRDASILMGGYVAIQKITYEEAERLLLQEADLIAPDEKTQNRRTVQNGLQMGVKKPVVDKGSFEDSLTKELKKEESLRFGKIYYTFRDSTDEIADLFFNGQVRGKLPGYTTLDELYSIKEGFTTYIYGHPRSGKTQLWLNILINLSKRLSWKHVVFSPETGTKGEIFMELIQIAAKQDAYPTAYQMDLDTFNQVTDFIDEHFIVIDPGTHTLNYDDIFAYILEIERAYGVKVNTLTIDPHNDLESQLNAHGGREDKALEVMLKDVRNFSRANNIHSCIITHTQKPDKRKQNVGGVETWYVPRPTSYDIAGGQTWFRRGMAMISCWIPDEGVVDENGNPYPENCSVITVQKAKPKGIGKLGETKLIYDFKTHNYYEGEHKEAK